ITDRADRVLGTRLAPADLDVRTSYHYNARGDLIRIEPPNYYAPPSGSAAEDFTITRTVDGLGRVTATHSSDAGTTEYIYDVRGLLRFPLDADGRSPRPGTEPDRVVYTRYDRLGRPTETGVVPVTWNRATLQALADTEWPLAAADWRERHSWDGDGTT